MIEWFARTIRDGPVICLLIMTIRRERVRESGMRRLDKAVVDGIEEPLCVAMNRGKSK